MRSPLLGLFLDLRRDRLRVGIDLLEHVPDDVVLERGVEQVVGVEVEAAPLERRLRRPLQELARRVAEELGHVDPLDLALLRRGHAARRLAVPPSPKKSEKKSSKRLRRPPRRLHALLSEVDLAEVLDLLAFRPGVSAPSRRLPAGHDAGKRAGRP